ncbi:hypothetical protein C7E18_23910, partial [Stenotrophomonas maltophilia]
GSRASWITFVLVLAYSGVRQFGWKRLLLLALVATLGCVLLLAGSRASWITFVLVLAYSGVRQFGWKRLLLLALVA